MNPSIDCTPQILPISAPPSPFALVGIASHSPNTFPTNSSLASPQTVPHPAPLCHSSCRSTGNGVMALLMILTFWLAVVSGSLVSLQHTHFHAASWTQPSSAVVNVGTQAGSIYGHLHICHLKLDSLTCCKEIVLKWVLGWIAVSLAALCKSFC